MKITWINHMERVNYLHMIKRKVRFIINPISGVGKQKIICSIFKILTKFKVILSGVEELLLIAQLVRT